MCYWTEKNGFNGSQNSLIIVQIGRDRLVSKAVANYTKITIWMEQKN